MITFPVKRFDIIKIYNSILHIAMILDKYIFKRGFLNRMYRGKNNITF